VPVDHRPREPAALAVPEVGQLRMRAELQPVEQAASVVHPRTPATVAREVSAVLQPWAVEQARQLVGAVATAARPSTATVATAALEVRQPSHLVQFPERLSVGAVATVARQPMRRPEVAESAVLLQRRHPAHRQRLAGAVATEVSARQVRVATVVRVAPLW